MVPGRGVGGARMIAVLVPEGWVGEGGWVLLVWLVLDGWSEVGVGVGKGRWGKERWGSGVLVNGYV